ncbi:MAG: hypothetical protein HRT56_00445 [Coraliomargarita sp.]|nr:hypothetical protein [Coraliomargarita sp.]
MDGLSDSGVMLESNEAVSETKIERCTFCEKPAEERFGGEPICLDCYIERGSCCQEQDE